MECGQARVTGAGARQSVDLPCANLQCDTKDDGHDVREGHEHRRDRHAAREDNLSVLDLRRGERGGWG